MDWCVRSPADTNHPPEARLAGPADRLIKAGETIVFDASGSSDPDGDELSYSWWIYDDIVPCDAAMEMAGVQEPVFRLTVGEVDEPQDLHVVVTVTDGGEPGLTRYARSVVRIEP
jgi:hypothetical protein